MNKVMCNNFFLFLSISPIVIISIMLTSINTSADTDVIDHVLLQVPTACTLSGTGMNSHTATINSGQYNSAVGETTMKAVCNDQNGFAIYAVGYTDDTDGKNVLASSTLGSTYDIATNTNTSGTSSWAMKLSTVTSPTPTYPITIQNSFNAFHNVPNEYTLVAKRESATDSGTNPEGSILKTTYQVYISTTQPSDTYLGQVKYTLVHPHNTGIPGGTMLDTGSTVCAKMKTLAAGTSTTCGTKTSDIKAIRMADSLPSGFTPSDANTVSASTSAHPIYIFFDNTNDAGIMYFYSAGYQVVMNPNSSTLFRGHLSLSDISGLTTWDSSNVTNMSGMFMDSTISLTNLNALANWDTSQVENLYFTFGLNTSTVTAGYTSQLSDISALANWNTSNVETMRTMFQYAPLQDYSALAFWDTSNVVNMSRLFNYTTITDTDTFSNWNTSSATDMSYLFYGSSITNVDGLSDWDTSGVTNMCAMFAGTNITNADGLSGWETSGVTDMSYLFYESSITNVDGLSDWDTSGVTNMYAMFYDTDITNVNGLADWDVSKVEDMSYMFKALTNKYTDEGAGTRSQLTDISGLADWDVGSVQSMESMFENVDLITSLEALSGWDTSSVTNMNYMFYMTDSLENLNGLRNWDTSKVTTMARMFQYTANLKDSSAIEGWDVRAVDAGSGGDSTDNGFYRMFLYSSKYPGPFTLRPGTWISGGTYSPSS